MEHQIESANYQKFCKLSLLSNESIEFSREDSIDAEVTPSVSISPLLEEIQNLVSILKLTLNTRGIQQTISSSPIDTLKSLISTICTEFLKATQNFKEIYIQDSTIKSTEDVSVNIFPHSDIDVLTKIFEMPERGVRISQNECKSLSALLVGAVRDSASQGLRKKISDLEEVLIKCGKHNSELLLQAKKKDTEIKELRNEIERIKSGKINRFQKSGKYAESESTLNESGDVYNS